MFVFCNFPEQNGFFLCTLKGNTLYSSVIKHELAHTCRAVFVMVFIVDGNSEIGAILVI